MTVSSDLIDDVGIYRRLFLKIHGVKEIFWQNLKWPDVDGGYCGYDIPGPHPIGNDCIAAWRLDEPGAINSTDNSGNGHTLTCAAVAPTAITGKFEYGRELGTAINKYFNIAASTQLELQKFTFCFWYKAKTTTPIINSVIYGSNNGGGSSAVLIKTNTATVTPGCTLNLNGGALSAFCAAPISYNVWHHIAVRWDGTTLDVFVDGALAATNTAGGARTIQYVDGVDSWSIGCHAGDNTLYHYCNLDDFLIYGTVKSNEWIRRAYAWCDYARPGLSVLNAPDGEYSHSLDLSKMTTSASAMSFDLDEVADPSDKTKSFFGKLFAPGRFSNIAQSKITYLLNPTSTDDYLDSNATTIYCKENSSFPASGYACIGQETFSYTGKSAHANYSEFTGVTKGLYPALTSSNFGYTYEMPASNLTTFEGILMSISTNPFSLVGRDVGLYVTTYDRVNKRWYTEAQAQLIWAGNISDQILFNSQRRKWTISCESILKKLEKKIGNGLKETTLSNVCNFNGNKDSRTIKIYQFGTSFSYFQNYCEITLPVGEYSPRQMCDYINSQINNGANWSLLASYCIYYFGLDEDDKTVVHFNPNPAIQHTGIYSLLNETGLVSEEPGYILRALGFEFGRMLEVEFYDMVTLVQSGTQIQSSKCAFKSFQPVPYSANGGLMFVKSPSVLWAKQGDLLDDQAFVECNNAYLIGDNTKGSYITTYNGLGADHLTLEPTQYWPVDDSLYPYIGNRYGESDTTIKQVYMPVDDIISSFATGPTKLLLYPMLSTGTENYNGTSYDKLNQSLALAIPEDLVDVDSFDFADSKIRNIAGDLSLRRIRPISKAISFNELIQPELQLFGYCLVWDYAYGWITLKNVIDQDINLATVTLDDSNSAFDREWPKISSGLGNVINSWTCELEYSHFSKKSLNELIIRDAESISGTGTTKEIKIKHDGIFSSASIGGYDAAGNSTKVQKAALERIVQRSELFRYPWFVTDRSLKKILFGLVNVGDLIIFKTSHLPDPHGSGTFSVDTKALVLDVNWNLKTWAGNCKLLVFAPWRSSELAPWGPSAVATAYNLVGGNHLLTLNARTFGLTGDIDDGVAFSNGDYIRIIERWPTDPTAPQVYDKQVTATYETDGANLLRIDSAPAAWDAAKEYIVVFDDYADVATAQKSLGTWQANNTDGLLNAVDQPQRYG